MINVRDNLNNLIEIYEFLSQLVLELGEKELYKPILIPYYHGKIKKDCGVSCFTFLKNGGYLTFHIFEKRKIAYFDIVSTNKIDKKIVTSVTSFCQTNKFNIYKNEINVQDRNSFFGPHYFAEGKLRKKLNTDELLDFQNEIIKGIKMTPIINPIIVKTNKTQTLFVAIAESHIALTKTDNVLRVDVFSCKEFDINELKQIAYKFIDVQEEVLFTRHSKVVSAQQQGCIHFNFINKQSKSRV